MFTPTAEKLVPDLTPREELVVLARALWREGYNDHLAGHITVNLGDGTLLCNPWLLTWAELRPSQVLRIDLDGRVVEGDWPVPLGIPLHLELHKAASGRGMGRAQPPALRHRVGRPGRGAPDPRPELRARAAARWCWSTSTRAPSTTPRARGRRWRRWAAPPWRCWPGTACSFWAVRPGPCTSGRWRSSSAASTPGMPGRPAAPASPGCPQAFIDLVAQSDGEGFIGFWEAAVRAELAADPDAARTDYPDDGPEDLVQLHRHRRVELVVRARRRVAVGAPAHEGRGVAEAVLLQVVVGDLARPPRPARGSQVMSLPAFQRLPPPGRPAGRLGIGPARPGVVLRARPSGRARARRRARAGGPR